MYPYAYRINNLPFCGHADSSAGCRPPPLCAAGVQLRPRAALLALHHHQQDPRVHQLRRGFQPVLPSSR